MRRILALLVAICAVVGCRHAAHKDPPPPRTKIGVLLPLTGPLASYGKACEEGIRLAADACPNLDLVWEDDQGKADLSVEAFRRLDKAGVSAVIGPLTSTCALAVAPLADSAGLPIVSPSASHFDVTAGHPCVFRVCFVDPMQGSALAMFARENLHLGKIAALLQRDEAYSKSLSEAFRQAFHALGGTVVLVEEYDAGTTDFAPLLARVKAAQAEALFVPGFVHEVAALMKEAKASAPGLRILGGDGWDSPELFALAGAAAEGHFYTSQFTPTDADPTVEEFVEAHYLRYGHYPGMFAALGRDALARVATYLGDGTRASIRDALDAGAPFRGVTGDMTFDKAHNPVKPVVILRTLADRAVFETRVTYGPR